MFFIQLFSLDKKYYDYALTSEQLKSEAWEYFELCGKYDSYSNHKESFKQFCTKIETIKNWQISREFSGKADNGDKNNNSYHSSSEMKPYDFSQETKIHEENIIDSKETISEILKENKIKEIIQEDTISEETKKLKADI